MFMVQICANQANILGQRVYLKDSRSNTLSIYIFSDKNGLVYRAICPGSSSLRHSTCIVRVKVALCIQKYQERANKRLILNIYPSYGCKISR